VAWRALSVCGSSRYRRDPRIRCLPETDHLPLSPSAAASRPRDLLVPPIGRGLPANSGSIRPLLSQSYRAARSARGPVQDERVTGILIDGGGPDALLQRIVADTISPRDSSSKVSRNPHPRLPQLHLCPGDGAGKTILIGAIIAHRVCHGAGVSGGSLCPERPGLRPARRSWRP